MMSQAVFDLLRCPRDGEPMRREQGTLRCTGCAARFGVDDGVIRFLGEMDPFYEGTYNNHVRYVPRHDRWPYTLPLWLINSGYLWEVRNQVAPGRWVLELGCSSGVAYFATRYRMIGLDVSRSALDPLVGQYAGCLQASALGPLPIATGVLDAVVSSYFWEHLLEHQKTSLAREIHRVLKPRGTVVFLYDIETSNPLLSWFRDRDPARYRTHFLDSDGHLGYHTSRHNEQIFRDAGFEVTRHRGWEKTPLQSPSTYEKLENWPGFFSGWFNLVKRLGRPPWFYVYTLLMRVIDCLLEPILPRDWARIELTTLRSRTPEPTASRSP